MAVHVCSIGINDYVGTQNDLTKCVNDANGFSALFKSKPTLLNRQATLPAVIKAVQFSSSLTQENEWYVGHYSGHGSQIPDNNHDELDGKDEVIVTADLKYLVDDQFPSLIAARNPHGRYLQVFDSCFSGDMTRAFTFTKEGDVIPELDTGKARFLNPVHLQKAPRKAIQNKYTSPYLPQVIVISGCSDFEYSYEGEKYGVLTGALIQSYRPSYTIGQWFIGACTLIQNSSYGSKQHPQINCHPSCLNWSVPSVK